MVAVLKVKPEEKWYETESWDGCNYAH
jgi:hypothetical protein